MKQNGNKDYSLSKSLSQSKISSLHETWFEFIGRFEPFEWYLTLTFREATHPEEADKRFRRFVRIINEFAYGRRYREKGIGVVWVRALEWQKRGVLHFHVLMSTPRRLRRLFFMDWWYKYNGFARIVPYNPKLNARGYLSKYVVKGGELDIFVSPYRARLLNEGSLDVPE